MGFILFILVVNLLLTCLSFASAVRFNRSSVAFGAALLASLELIAVIIQIRLMFGGVS